MKRRDFGALAYLAVAACAGRTRETADASSAPPTGPQPMPSAPLDPGKTLTRIGFGSCYVPQFEEPEVWNAVRAAAPDVFLYIGDNVYQTAETGHPDLVELHEAYASLAADAPFAALRQSTPVLVTWDDHDYGMNDAGAEFPARLQSEALFKTVWAVGADDPRATRPGVYYAKSAGPAGRRTQLILLDTRYFRTPDTMLGDAQWRWLAEALAEPADVRILASSIPVLSNVATGETWSKWPAERGRLLALLGRSNGVVIVSGDSHFGAFFTRSDGVAYPLHELTSSSLNFPMTEDAWLDPGLPDTARNGAAYYPANFGMVTIDWAVGALSLNLNTAAGELVRSERMELATLSSGR